MKIRELYCDVCKKSFPFSKTIITNHLHSNLDIDGIPINFWTPFYDYSDSEKEILTKKWSSKDLTFGDGNTNLYKDNYLSNKYKSEIFIKDETTNSTGSFKDRGFPLLLADAINEDKNKIAIPSTGNAAISLCFYARKNNLTPLIFAPKNISQKKKEIITKYADVIFDNDIIESWNHFFSYCKNHQEIYNGFTVTNIPYQQGLKNIMLEIFLQLGNKIPDWIIIPCGSGGNFVSQYQACLDLKQMKFSKKLPKFVSVQIKGADPLTVGFNKKQYKEIVILKNIKKSKAEGIIADTCFNYFKIMDILKKTKGKAISVTDKEIDLLKNKENEKIEYTSLSVFAALEKLKPFIKKGEKVVLILTAKRK